MTRSELLAAYALELVSELLTREKREYMIKQKWAKSGRESLGKDLGDIESSLCLANKSTPSPHASALLPVFLGLRRTYALPKSPISPAVIEPYLDLLPIPPDPDDVPFREPTVQTTTAALYVNPRLDDVSAYEVLEELIANEQEKVEAEGALPDEVKSWLTELISGVEKRVSDISDDLVSVLTAIAVSRRIIRLSLRSSQGRDRESTSYVPTATTSTPSSERTHRADSTSTQESSVQCDAAIR
jgi:hypothetical protein